MSASADDGKGNIAENVIDGDLTTRWSAETIGGDDHSAWLQIDCGGFVDVGAVDIAYYQGAERLSMFVLEGSDDGVQWRALSDELVSAGMSDGLERFYLITTPTVRYLRYVGLGNSVSAWNSIAEIQLILGDTPIPEATPTPAPTATPAPVGNLDPDVAPSENFDLTRWKLRLPDYATDVSETAIANGFEEADRFYTGADGGMVFKVMNNDDTGGSNYPRTELRSMLRAGDTRISTHGINGNNWVFSSSSDANKEAAGGVDGTLTATVAVNYVSRTGGDYQIGRVIVGQIHDENDEPIRLYYRKLPNNDNGSIYFVVTGESVEHEVEVIGSMENDAANPVDGIALNEPFTYVIDARGNDLTVTIKREGKADVVATHDWTNDGFEDKWMYFKAGAYNQNNAGDSDEYVQVTFYYLDMVFY